MRTSHCDLWLLRSSETDKQAWGKVKVVVQTTLKVDAPTALYLLPDATLKQRVMRPSAWQQSVGDKAYLIGSTPKSPASSIFTRQSGGTGF